MQSIQSHTLLNNSTGSSSGKLMSISSMMAATPPLYSTMYHQEAMERRASAPSRPYNHLSLRASPPTDKLSLPSSPTLSVSSFSTKRYMDDDMGHPPLTLQERRLRNKAASAKYRQKKNQQQSDMRTMIGRLSEQNAVLERQVQELRLENERLKSTADKLRSKMVAKKMLKKWIGRQNYASSASEPDMDDHDLESIDSQ